MFLLGTTNHKSITNSLQNTLKSGSFVVFSIRERIDPDSYRILLYGKLMNVRSSKPLTLGSSMRAQVLWVENRLQLNVLKKNGTITDILSRLNIVINKETQIIAEGLIRSGMPLLLVYFKKMGQFLRKYKEIDDKFVRVLLLMMDKGIPLNDRNISEIYSFSSSHKQNHFSGWKKSEKREQDINSEDIKDDIKEQIKKTDLGNELLKYFNHRIAKHGNWLILPIRYSFKRNGSGVLKLRLDEYYNVTNFVLSLYDEKNWEFNMVKDKNFSNMNVHGPENISWKDTVAFRKLKEKLYNIGIQFDDITNKKAFVSDGFSAIIPEKFDSIDFVI